MNDVPAFLSGLEPCVGLQQHANKNHDITDFLLSEPSTFGMIDVLPQIQSVHLVFTFYEADTLLAPGM